MRGCVKHVLMHGSSTGAIVTTVEIGGRFQHCQQHMQLSSNSSSADVKTFFFWSSPDFTEKIAQGVIWSHIFQKGAIVQKRLKTSVLMYQRLLLFIDLN